MSDLSFRGTDETIFHPLTVALMLAIGLLGFIGALMLSAYGPDLRKSEDGLGHALSDSAIGFSGLVRLARETGHQVDFVRDRHQWGEDGLLIVTPPIGTIDVGEIIQGRSHEPTLIILPKWQTVEDTAHKGWIRIDSLLPAEDPAGVLAPQSRLAIKRVASGGRALTSKSYLPANIHFDAPRPIQLITGFTLSAQVVDGNEVPSTFYPLIADRDGAVLAQIGPTPLYVLADPDLVDNAGLKSFDHARAALALIEWLATSSQTHRINFDVTLNGLGHARSPLTLAFDPPFLAMTLTVAFVLVLLGLSAPARFGAPRPRERAIAFGKAALVDNSAALVRKGGRAHRLGARYAAVIRERAARAFGASTRIKGEAVDAYLDGLGHGSFSERAAAAEAANDDTSLLAAAQALYDWQQERKG
jgi:hypothetical protein